MEGDGSSPQTFDLHLGDPTVEQLHIPACHAARQSSSP